MNRKWIPRSAYFTTGVVANLFTTALVLYYLEIGFNEAQIGILASVSFLAAIFQPVLGVIIDRSRTPKKIYQFIIISFLLNLFIMSLTTNFYFYIILVFLASISRIAFFAALDAIVIKSVDYYGGNFGSIRNFASIGFGIGMLVAYPFIINDIYNFFYVSIVVGIINILVVGQLHNSTNEKEVKKLNIKNDMATLFNNKVFMGLIITNFFMFGMMNIKMTYQPILLQSLGASAFMISLSSIIMTGPEIILMPLFNTVRRYVSDKSIFIIATTLTSIQLLLFSQLNNVYIVLALVSVHGLVNGFYIPLYSQTIVSTVDDKLSSTALMISITTQFLLTSVISLFIITPIYVKYGLNMVFLLLSMITFLSIFSTLYAFKHKK